MSRVKVDIDKLIDGYYESSIHQYHSKYGKRAEGYAQQKIYAKSEIGKQKLLESAIKGTKKAKEWRKNNKELSSRIGSMGGQTSKTPEGRARMAKLGSKYGKIYGGKFLPKDSGELGKENLLKELVCEECGKKVNRGNYHQFHGDKCKEKQKKDLLNLLPNPFTSVELKNIAEQNSIKNYKSLNLLHHTCPYTECIKKGSNQFNPGVYKKLI